ncbi:MAG: DUF4268 domain-containing protein [Bacteroidales bacterium]|nr:DUF4268 domain-containing protein [Bacteroidales bacterium]
MIFSYKKEKREIKLHNETTFRDQNILERQDLEVWIEQKPEILGVDLLIISTEYDQFDKTNERLDLLAIDRDGKLVVIELKRDDSGRNVDLQALKYAAYCSTLTLEDVLNLFANYRKKKGEDSNIELCENKIREFITNDDFEDFDDKPRIIIVAKEYRPEVTASVMWLRKFDLDITCVKLTPYEINTSELLFESNILIPLPEAKDYLMKAERKDDKAKNLTRGQKEYLEFYTDLKKKLEESVGISLAACTPRYNYQVPTGITGVHFEWSFHGRPRSGFTVQLHFETKKDFNYAAIEYFKQFVMELEEITGERVIVQERWGNSWSRLYVEKQQGQITEELKSWAIDNMKIFYTFLKPKVEEFLEK